MSSSLPARMWAWFAAPAKKHHELPWSSYSRTYVQSPGQPVWMRRDYARFADEAYVKNVIAHRAINMIASGVASIGIRLTKPESRRNPALLEGHPLALLIARPNPFQSRAAFFEALLTTRLIAGNVYIQAAGPEGEVPQELHLLRPDRVAVITGRSGVPAGYRYKVGEAVRDYPVDPLTGRSRVLHLKTFHPLDDWYGLSPIEAAAYSIDQHNQAGAWNQALLQNGARPSGAVVVQGEGKQPGTLSEEQYHRLKGQIEEQYAGAANAGRPILLEGGLDWKEMSLSPKDMDYINAKHSSARDIALAFGVPPQLLGIPGDNTYSNLAEARLALWEQTIMPLAEQLIGALNHWLVPMFDSRLNFVLEEDAISALSIRRESLWDRIRQADFLTDDEKRKLVGVSE